MGAPIFVCRLRVTNAGGTWDSLNIDDPREQPRIAGVVRRSLSQEPNTADVRVYNLAPDTVARITGVVTTRLDWTPAERAQLLAAGASTAPLELTSDTFGLGTIELSWGYADSETIGNDGELEAALGVGFIGQVTDGPREERAGLDLVLRMLAQDAGHTLGAAEVVQQAGGGTVAHEGKSYAAGTRVSAILGDMINAIGLSSDVSQLDSQLAAAFADKGYPLSDLVIGAGYNASGPVRPQIEALLRNLGLRWSIQNGDFLILDSDSVIPGFAPLDLGSDQLIGTPKEGAGTLEVSTAANPEALPGRQVDVTTEGRRVSYRTEEAETPFDTYSGAQTDMKLQELQTIPGLF